MKNALGVALTVLLTLGLGGCGDDDGGDGAEGGGTSSGAGTSGGAGRGGSSSGGGGSGSGTGSGSTADDIAMCMMMGAPTGSEDCEGIDEYSACIQEACEEGYKTCLGDDYKSGDFSGGMCESLGECTAEAADPCTCEPDSACIMCFTNNLVSCSLNSGCALPDCGGGTGTAGTGGLPASDKTCDDLADCCASLEGAAMMSCMLALQASMGIGDAACGAAYSGFMSLGCE